MTSKYDPLGDYLMARPASEISMSFSDIEKVIGSPLPPKAVNHPAWWSNNTSNNTMTKVWLDAGFRTERVDIGARKLVFRRSGRARDLAGELASQDAPAQELPRGPAGGLLSRLRAVLAGSVRVAPDMSLTEPTGETWDAAS